jgi:uncharacterized protein YjlB
LKEIAVLLQDIKEKVERSTGIWRPAKKDLADAVRTVRAQMHRFSDDGLVPNNPNLPLVHYKRAFKFAKKFDPAAVVEEVFAANGWSDSWRDGIYDFDHFHAKTHEALGIAKGRARVRFGGEHGELIAIAAGDVIVLPAGTGHMRIRASDNVVGAYPRQGVYDEHKASTSAAIKRAIERVPLPKSDPLYGKTGGVMKLWR